MRDEILKEFEAESKTIVQDALLILSSVQENLEKRQADFSVDLLKNCVALLVDATKIVEKILKNLHLSGTEIFTVIPQNFIERLS